jgi:uncharacterized glyoxalase superfamily protein PhnB
MRKSVTAMLHVPDVDRTLSWYEAIGFTVLDTGKDDGETVWAMVAYGEGRVMFSIGGRTSDAHRREVDLYVETSDVDALYENLKDRVEVFEGPHDTFYGMREFIIRDVNRFWITFGERSQTTEGNR